MSTPTQSAINEAEAASRPTLPDNHPVALSNGALLTLIAAAKGAPQETEYIEKLEVAIKAAIVNLTDVIRA